MEKFVKLQSVQAGPFTTPANRMIDFDIPEGHLIDMSKSFVQLTCSIDPNIAYANYPYNLGVRSPASENYNIMNVELIRNAFLNSGKHAQLENIRRVNILRKNLLELTQTSAQKLSLQNSLYGLKTFDNHKNVSPFLEMHKTGSIPSKYRNVSLKIPMSHLFELGAMEVFDTNKLGKVRCHLELESLSNFVVEEIPLESINDNACNNVPTQGGSFVTLTKLYDSLENVPYFVGQQVDIHAIGAAGAQYLQLNSITAITYDEVSKALVVSLEVPFPALAAPATYTNVSITQHIFNPAIQNAGTFNVLTAEICLAELDGLKVPSPNELEFMTFTTEEYSVNTTWMNKVFEIEPEATNVWCMFHRDSVPANLLSVNNGLEKYRLRNDTVDIIDRDCLVNKTYPSLADPNILSVSHDGLHYDLIAKLCKNGGYTLSNVGFVEIARSTEVKKDLLTEPDNRIMIVGSPVPQTPGTKKYQINLTNTTGNIENVILYKQVLRSIKL